jgi:hypothetical protein
VTRPMPRRASVTDELADRSRSNFPDMGPGPGDIVSQLTGPTDGLRGRLGDVRVADSGRLAPGVHDDVDTGRARNAADDDAPVEGDQLVDVSGDERLAPGGAAEWEFTARTARHRGGTWPRDDAVLVDLRDVREGRYGPG